MVDKCAIPQEEMVHNTEIIIEAESWEKLRMVIIDIERRFDSMRRTQVDFESKNQVSFRLCLTHFRSLLSGWIKI